MKRKRAQRPKQGQRELRLVVPESRLESVRARVSAQVARLPQASEDDALAWIEIGLGV